MLKRPRKEEDEEDLLKLQEEFISKKQQSSAQVTSVKSEEQPQLADNHDIPIDFEVNVVERDTSNCIVKPPSRPSNSKLSFPQAFKIKKESLITPSGSLFARSVGLKREDNESKSNNVQFEKSRILDGSGLGNERSELDTIHFENCQKLSGMTPEEIKEAQKQILAKLKPEVVDFLKKGKRHKSNLPSPKASTSKEDTMELDKFDANQLPITPDQVSQHKWLNMDKLEKDKLEWLKQIPEEKSDQIPSQDILNQLGIKDARFNLEGNIITDEQQQELTGKEGLHHHGDEPERGGYTLTELLTLLESSFASQKIIALNLVGRIMEKSNRGVFDHLLEMSSLAQQLLEYTPVLLIVRKSLDDTSNSVVTAALACLKQIICNLELDELYLDRIFSWFFMSSKASFPHYLDPEYKGEKNEPIEEMADDEYVKKDPISALIRTDLLTRLAYLLEYQVKEQDDPVAVKNLFAILIRISRHSVKACEAISQTPYLLGHIIKYFVQPSFVSMKSDTFYGNPYCKGVKLLRILCQEQRLAYEIYHSFGDQVASACSSYLALDPLSLEDSASSKKKASDFLQLVQEALKLLSVLTFHGLALDAIQVMAPILVRQTQYFLTLDPVAVSSNEKQFDWQYASSLIIVLRNVLRHRNELRPIYHEIIEKVVFQWITQIIQSNCLPNSVDASNAIMSGVIFLLGCPNSTDIHVLNQFASDIKKNECKLMDKIFQLLVRHSCIVHAEKNLTETRSCRIHPEYHSLLEASGKIHGVLADENVIPLIYSIICVIKYLNSIETNESLIKAFISNSSLVKFICKVSQCTYGTDSFFTQYEVNIIKEIISLASNVLNSDLDEVTQLYLLTAIRLVPMMKNLDEKKNFFLHVILNGKLHPNQLPCLLEATVNIGPTTGKSTLNELLENVSLVYSNLTPLSTEYWIFDPILYVTKVVKSVTSEETDFTQVLQVTFSFIQLLLDSCPGYFNFTKLNENNNRFTAVSLILVMGTYLTGNKYFLDSKIKAFLKTLIELYLVHETPQDKKYLLSSKSIIPGQLLYGKECKMSSPTIGQFFQRLLHEYAAESYSDPLFTSYLLLFLRSSQESLGEDSMRLLFFSQDNTELLESMYTRIENFDHDLLIQLFGPCEKDIQAIELFTKCLLSGNVKLIRNPVCYWMLVYHVHHFLFKEENSNYCSDEKKKCSLITSINSLQDESIKGHLTQFKLGTFNTAFLLPKK